MLIKFCFDGIGLKLYFRLLYGLRFSILRQFEGCKLGELFWRLNLRYSGCDPAHIAKVWHLPSFKSFRAVGDFLFFFGHSLGSA
jgi:hypothetical protein